MQGARNVGSAALTDLTIRLRIVASFCSASPPGRRRSAASILLTRCISARMPFSRSRAFVFMTSCSSTGKGLLSAPSSLAAMLPMLNVVRAFRQLRKPVLDIPELLPSACAASAPPCFGSASVHPSPFASPAAAVLFGAASVSETPPLHAAAAAGAFSDVADAGTFGAYPGTKGAASGCTRPGGLSAESPSCRRSFFSCAHSALSAAIRAAREACSAGATWSSLRVADTGAELAICPVGGGGGSTFGGGGGFA